MLHRAIFVVCMVIMISPLRAAETTTETTPISAQRAATMPFPPYRIVGNVYYVGTRDLGIFLITTPKGNILINSGFESTVPMIKDSIQKLGFKYSDTKILLISHAHSDHDGGSAQIIKDTGAKYEVMDADVPTVESGGEVSAGERPGKLSYPPAKVDRVLHDGDTVSLGGTVLTAHKTAGHTKGCTTWTLKVQDGGKLLNVVIVGSAQSNSTYKLINNDLYPSIAQDYEHTFQVMEHLPVDVFLGSHGVYYDMVKKYAELKTARTNPFVDPAGYRYYVMSREAAFYKELARQEAGGRLGGGCLRQCGDWP